MIPLEERHIDSAYRLLSDYLEEFKLYPIYTRDEFAHFFTPRDKVIYAYVIEVSGVFVAKARCKLSS